MKKTTWLVALAAIALVGLVGVACAPGGSATNGGTLSGLSIPPGALQQNGIWVTGEGKVKVTPDIAVLSLGIESQAKSVAEAQQKAQDAMDAVVKVLKDQGIAEKDIRTERFNISPQYRYIERENRPEIIGYVVSNIVTAKVRNVANAGKVIDGVAGAGGDLTRIISISFTMEDTSALEAQAQELALKDARAKGKLIADILSVRLGKVTYAQINAAPVAFPMPIFAAKAEGGAPARDTSISPGEITIQATATVAWAVE
ncbi:MAG: SIMPL domain-containing protein [Chloroflexi bacterium]|nr:SIMPL domain-containing protein [Chloroflexota bacterium]